MSDLSSVSSTSDPYRSTSQTDFGQTIQDFNALGSALQSGSLSTAQSALSSFQNDLQSNSQTSTSKPFGSNSKANADYQSLASALQTGNVSAAQQAFTNLQTDLKSAHKTHHHRGSSADSSAAAALIANTTASPATDNSGDGSLNVTA
jgi:hypothetical protein